jgi:hypothetical protein
MQAPLFLRIRRGGAHGLRLYSGGELGTVVSRCRRSARVAGCTPRWVIKRREELVFALDKAAAVALANKVSNGSGGSGAVGRPTRMERFATCVVHLFSAERGRVCGERSGDLIVRIHLKFVAFFATEPLAVTPS